MRRKGLKGQFDGQTTLNSLMGGTHHDNVLRPGAKFAASSCILEPPPIHQWAAPVNFLVWPLSQKAAFLNLNSLTGRMICRGEAVHRIIF